MIEVEKKQAQDAPFPYWVDNKAILGSILLFFRSFQIPLI
jgi:hypothetical protein